MPFLSLGKLSVKIVSINSCSSLVLFYDEKNEAEPIKSIRFTDHESLNIYLQGIKDFSNCLTYCNIEK